MPKTKTKQPELSETKEVLYPFLLSRTPGTGCFRFVALACSSSLYFCFVLYSYLWVKSGGRLELDDMLTLILTFSSLMFEMNTAWLRAFFS